MSDQQQPGQQINIELGEKEAEGIYSNLAIITHSPAEFVIDFTRVLPGVPKAKVHARLIMTAVFIASPKSLPLLSPPELMSPARPM